jgi:UDP:flavonoid glycosyltransferase YjiC (YdhE family)
MICVPINADQPVVAYRVADELGLGVNFDFTKMTSNDIRQAVHKIFNDKSYYERIDHYAEISKKHNGYSNAAKLISELLIEKSL